MFKLSKKLIIFCSLVLMTVFIKSELTASQDKKLNVGILVYDGVYLLDFCGPLEIFYDTMINDSTAAFNVFVVSPDESSIKSHTNTLITADYTIKNSPSLDILVIPGGNLNLATQSPDVARWIKDNSETSKITLSVCTGAFILADLGLLDNLQATTWYGATARLQKKYPKVKIVTDRRFTDNGKIITTAGVSAGIDGALYVVEKLFGKEIADNTAKYIEWKK